MSSRLRLSMKCHPPGLTENLQFFSEYFMLEHQMGTTMGDGTTCENGDKYTGDAQRVRHAGHPERPL